MASVISGILVDGQNDSKPAFREYLAARERASGENFVLIVSGQSNAVGRATNPIYDASVAAYTFTRTYIWVRRAGVGAWELLTPSDNTQSVDQGAGAHGVEPYFAYLFERYMDPLDKLYIIKYAVGATALAENPHANGDWAPTSTGEHYDTLVDDYLTPAFAASPLATSYRPLGFWWMQGESDSVDSSTLDTGSPTVAAYAYATAYYTNLAAFFAALGVDVTQTQQFGRYIGRISTYSGWTYREAVRIAQYRYCIDVAVNQAVLVDTDSASRMVSGGDPAHYGADGFAYLAPRLFKAMTGIGASHLMPPVPPYAEEDSVEVELRGSSGAATTPALGTLRYTLQGRHASLNFSFGSLDLTGASGTLRISGLPFAGANFRSTGIPMVYGLSVPNKYLVAFWDAGNTHIDFYSPSDDGAWTQVNVTAASGKTLHMTIDGSIG